MICSCVCKTQIKLEHELHKCLKYKEIRAWIFFLGFVFVPSIYILNGFYKLFPWLSKMAIYLLYGFINYFYQQARWLKGRNKMCLNEKKLRFVLSDYSFKGRESSLILIIQWNLLTFQCDVGCQSVYGMQRKI